LKDIKESYKISLADFSKEKRIDNEPAFKWWVGHVRKKRDKVIAVVKARIWKKTHTFGAEVPWNIVDAYWLDQENGKLYWKDAISKKMSNVKVAFNILSEDEYIPIGYQRILVHMIFDFKMDLT